MKKAIGREFKPSELRLLSGEPGNRIESPILRCYYCSLQGTSHTTLVRDGKQVFRWVCPDHLMHRPTRLTKRARSGRVSPRFREGGSSPFFDGGEGFPLRITRQMFDHEGRAAYAEILARLAVRTW